MRAPKTAKRARIEQLRLQNEIDANVKECARAAVITHSRSLAEQARISLRKEEELTSTLGTHRYSLDCCALAFTIGAYSCAFVWAFVCTPTCTHDAKC